MPNIHILTGGAQNIYTAVVHTATPAGNNLAGVSWKDALKASGLNVSIMPIGVGAGQMSVQESNQLQSGDIFESVILWQNDPNWNPAQRNADLDTRAAQASAAKLIELQSQLSLYGMTRG